MQIIWATKKFRSTLNDINMRQLWSPRAAYFRLEYFSGVIFSLIYQPTYCFPCPFSLPLFSIHSLTLCSSLSHTPTHSPSHSRSYSPSHALSLPPQCCPNSSYYTTCIRVVCLRYFNKALIFLTYLTVLYNISLGFYHLLKLSVTYFTFRTEIFRCRVWLR